MSEPVRRFGRLLSKFPSERDWDRSVVLEPRSASRQPAFVSDGAGLPFAPDALRGSPLPLDPDDPAVRALLARITGGATPDIGALIPWKRRDEPPVAPTPSLRDWRQLARTDDEALFARGRPPELLTVVVRREQRRGTWSCIAVSSGRPLRVTRDRIRASGWRLDPSRETDSAETLLRVLVTEQTYAGGKRADGRVLPPDLYSDADELVLTMFVTPRPGFQVRSPNPETPVRIALPHPVGPRQLIDGALYEAMPG